MKNKGITGNVWIVLCFLWITSAISQEYKPLLSQKNDWYLTYCYYGCLTDIYFTNGDTIVNDKTHKILDGYHYISREFLLSEDVETKKVYFTSVKDGFIEEYLLYDFSLIEGDSIDIKNPYTPFLFDAGYYQVDSIVLKKLVDGELYKHFYLSPTPSNTLSFNDAVWIEGVGSLSLINAPGGKPDVNGVGKLSCFYKNNELLYANLDSIAGCAKLSVDITDVSIQKTVLYSKRKSNIFYLNPSTELDFAEVFDLSGKKIKSILSNDFYLDMNGTKSGMYILVIKKGKQQKTYKFLVQ